MATAKVVTMVFPVVVTKTNLTHHHLGYVARVAAPQTQNSVISTTVKLHSHGTIVGIVKGTGHMVGVCATFRLEVGVGREDDTRLRPQPPRR